MYHDNFGVPLNGYENDPTGNGFENTPNVDGPTSRQDYEEVPPSSTGLRRPDSFNNYDGG
jgi:hypothetical protein